MANQKNQNERPAMDEEKRQGGYKDQRDQNKPSKQQPDMDSDKNQIPGQKNART